MESLLVYDFEEPSQEQILQELRQAVEELRLIEKGELTARPVKALLDELHCLLPNQE